MAATGTKRIVTDAEACGIELTAANINSTIKMQRDGRDSSTGGVVIEAVEQFLLDRHVKNLLRGNPAVVTSEAKLISLIDDPAVKLEEKVVSQVYRTLNLESIPESNRELNALRQRLIAKFLASPKTKYYSNMCLERLKFFAETTAENFSTELTMGHEGGECTCPLLCHCAIVGEKDDCIALVKGLVCNDSISPENISTIIRALHLAKHHKHFDLALSIAEEFIKKPALIATSAKPDSLSWLHLLLESSQWPNDGTIQSRAAKALQSVIACKKDSLLFLRSAEMSTGSAAKTPGFA